MVTQNTFDFLRNLAANNNKEWFDANRKKYEVVKQEFKDLVETFVLKIEEFDKQISMAPENIKIFRINRDVRFSKDKSPYKNNLGGYISFGGMKVGRAGYYIHIEPGNSGLAGGIHMPEPATLQKVRELVLNKYEDLLDIMEDKEFKKYFPDGFDNFDKLKTVPRGFDKDHPAADLLKNKSFAVWAPMSDDEILDKNFINEAVKRYKQIYKLNQFLNKVF